ncbi:TIGR00375 family protein [Oceanobacillus piezotolerans]|uniref:TIGR00375 family protein n=1 Tax=Oceanobacillus piezotolerans TaxID=2448030 RepID=A0A498DDL4_9BACI|nr:endonuclease Q family protein [Oceanobacillus piezotolerans]RLL48146.1 TIGR00375 family protein [Oceanobacillus piezotolerans]
MNQLFADLHIHIGRDMYDKPVKITGAKQLTLTNILLESSRNKGIELIGIIDCHVPAVQEEIIRLINEGLAYELEEGGIRFERTTLILGSEIEVYDEHCQGPIHVLCFLPNLHAMEEFTAWLAKRMKNITLSSQRYYGTGKALQYKVKELGGLFIPAHIFTPFKSLYGKGVKHSLSEILDADLIDAMELGLSSDTMLADQISELHRYTFVTNSDAHSLAKIGREYQEMNMKEASFQELNLALHEVDGRRISRNFGMDPRLGKYHSTVCSQCFTPVSYSASTCPTCGSKKIIRGVIERIEELSDGVKPNRERPTYQYQVPLEYLPGLGPKTYQKLLKNFYTEMNIIHKATFEQLIEVIPDKLARSIVDMRKGNLFVRKGGGGRYGKILPEEL